MFHSPVKCSQILVRWQHSLAGVVRRKVHYRWSTTRRDGSFWLGRWCLRQYFWTWVWRWCSFLSFYPWRTRGCVRRWVRSWRRWGSLTQASSGRPGCMWLGRWKNRDIENSLWLVCCLAIRVSSLSLFHCPHFPILHALRYLFVANRRKPLQFWWKLNPCMA